MDELKYIYVGIVNFIMNFIIKLDSNVTLM